MPKSKLLLDQPATVEWVEGMRPVSGKLLPDSRSKDFSSGRDALKFVMETLNPAGRDSALIQIGMVTLHTADIEAMYAKLT